MAFKLYIFINSFEDSLWPATVTIAKNNQITELAYIGKEYSVSFEVFINKYGTGTPIWTSILHLSTGGNNDVLGNRNPAIHFKNDENPPQFHIVAAVNGEKNFWGNFPSAEEKKWQKIEISQTLVDGKVVKIWIQ